MSNMPAIAKPFGSAASSERTQPHSADRLFATFREACAQGDLDLAAATLRLVEVSLLLMPEGPPQARKVMDSLVASYNTLWFLRHPEALAA